jgi:exonuclease VII small subunit
MAEAPNEHARSLEESMRRAFASIESLAEGEKKLDDALARLAQARVATQQSFEETERRFQETAKGFRMIDASPENPAQAQIDDERSRQLDAQIAKLLADIREWQDRQ